MSREIKTGGSAFPLPMGSETTQGSEGMTLRDYFAAQAMSSLIAEEWAPKDCAKQAYEFADTMIEARGK